MSGQLFGDWNGDWIGGRWLEMVFGDWTIEIWWLMIWRHELILLAYLCGSNELIHVCVFTYVMGAVKRRNFNLKVLFIYLVIYDFVNTESDFILKYNIKKNFRRINKFICYTWRKYSCDKTSAVITKKDIWRYNSVYKSLDV